MLWQLQIEFVIYIFFGFAVLMFIAMGVWFIIGKLTYILTPLLVSLTSWVKIMRQLVLSAYNKK